MISRLFKSLFQKNSDTVKQQGSGLHISASENSKSIPPVSQNQVWTMRQPHMETLIKQTFNYPVKMLEIGTWFGVGSTQIWLNNLKAGSTLMLLDAWRPYSSESDLNDGGFDYREMDSLSTDAFLSTFLRIKKCETKKLGINVQMVRGDSETFLPLLAENTFDCIYIDGDHKYQKVKSDIQHAKRLIKKEFGLICGDDLERLPTLEFVELAKNFKNRDYLREPHNYHPGVLLAVAEEFGQVNMRDGFWWIICKNGRFTIN